MKKLLYALLGLGFTLIIGFFSGIGAIVGVFATMDVNTDEGFIYGGLAGFVLSMLVIITIILITKFVQKVR